MFNKNKGVDSSSGSAGLYVIGIPATNTNSALPAFDAGNKRFNYRVNTAGIPNSSGDSFQVQPGLR